tara:strand:+ start:92 stop:748 length:657 start_codon:yes stop_codon:yes gene_type:complete
MRIESKLCHLTENKAIVQVCGWINEKKIGSALAEGSTVEDAEDKAINRLKLRLNIVPTDKTIGDSIYEDKAKTSLNVQLPKSEKININNEPLDWSDELTAIDSEIKRLKWSREDEIRYLEQTLGYNNRNKITKYNDIIKYLNLLKGIKVKYQNKFSVSNINTLIKESDILLSDLKWDHKQGRQFLQKEFNVLTRKDLNQDQLLSFVDKLKSIKNQELF